MNKKEKKARATIKASIAFSFKITTVSLFQKWKRFKPLFKPLDKSAKGLHHLCISTFKV